MHNQNAVKAEDFTVVLGKQNDTRLPDHQITT